MICSCFILGAKFNYNSFHWTSILKKLKLGELNHETLDEIKHYVMEKYDGDIDLITTSSKHDPEIKEMTFHVHIVIPEHTSFIELATLMKDIQDKRLKKYKKCLRFLGLTDRDPTLYSCAYRLTVN